MRARVWPLLAVLLVVAGAASAQQSCGDLDLDGDVDSDDALILRHELGASAPLSLEQALSCDVYSELRAPGLEPDPNDVAGRCSMSDAAVMTRRELALLPGPSPVCAFGSTADCCSAHPTIGCNSHDTVACVCAQDATCCTVDWDATCAALACTTACAPTCAPPADAYCAGSCRDTDTDLAHCGGCGAVCDLANATESCSAGQCLLGVCSPGSCDTDGAPGNGCESVIDDNPVCPGAPLVGSLFGDVPGAPFSFQVVTEAIFRVRVEEGAALGGGDLTARFSLVSPPGANYDLSLRCLSCGGAAQSSTQPAGMTDELTVGRADGSGDSRYEVVVEVRFAGGASCAAWNLTVTGNVATADRSCSPP